MNMGDNQEIYNLKQEICELKQEIAMMRQELHKNSLIVMASSPVTSEEQRKNALYELAQIKEQEAEVKLNSYIS